MPATHRDKSVSVEYARAMLELAVASHQEDEVAADLDSLAELVKSDTAFGIFLANPSISHARRATVLAETFKGKVSELVFNLLGVLNGKARLALVTKIAGSYHELLDIHQGRIDVHVTLASAPDAALLQQLDAGIGKAINKIPRLHPTVDPSIIGGMVLRIDDQLIDSSVRHGLDAMRRQLVGAGSRLEN
jgi:F-type H+-transporting ATPase subunit delta